MNADDRDAALALLRWYVEMGADEAIGSEAADRLAAPSGEHAAPDGHAPQRRSAGNRPAPLRPPHPPR